MATTDADARLKRASDAIDAYLRKAYADGLDIEEMEPAVRKLCEELIGGDEYLVMIWPPGRPKDVRWVTNIPPERLEKRALQAIKQRSH